MEAQTSWRAWDCVALLEDGHRRDDPLLVDVGSADPFLEEQRRTNDLKDAAARCGQPLSLTVHESYDHSYFFVASVIDNHLRHHARALGLTLNPELAPHEASTSTLQRKPGARAAWLSAVSRVAPSCSASATSSAS